MALSSYSQVASSRIPVRLAVSYVVDWIVIVGIAAIGVGFWKAPPNHRPFSPVDPELSYPYVENAKVPTYALAVASLLAPATITFLLAILLTPGPTGSKDALKSQIWRRKAWEWNTAWMGLGLGLATTFFFTEGMKNLFGKPRPDLLARCNLDPALVQQYALGGYGSQIPEWNLLVPWAACRQTDISRLNDGFQSFPSGHASFSWAGMFYLTLFLCSRFAITIPYLLPYKYSTDSTTSSYDTVAARDHTSPKTPLRKQAATPPAWTYILVVFPISVAIYIASTRYSDFKHHGFDILFGSLIGITCSWISFRLYHLPIRRGAGWSWGPRNAEKAWYIGVGVASYAGQDSSHKRRDVESGTASARIGNEAFRRRYWRSATITSGLFGLRVISGVDLVLEPASRLFLNIFRIFCGKGSGSDILLVVSSE